MSANPARLLGIENKKGSLREGLAADLVLVNPEETRTVDEGGFFTKGKGSPFTGKKLKGTIRAVYKNGREIAINNAALSAAQGTYG
jgi:dihydroorotase